MTFEEFLVLIRKEIGSYCTDHYWRLQYDLLKKKDAEYVRSELPYLAVDAVATDYVTRG